MNERRINKTKCNCIKTSDDRETINIDWLMKATLQKLNLK